MPLPKLIILEGADNCGKSTLARAIATYSEGVYLHATGRGRLPIAMNEYHGNLLDIAETNLGLGRQVVIDRHWPSEYIYSAICRPSTRDLKYDRDAMHERILNLGGIYVYCSSMGALTRHAAAKDHDHPYRDDVYELILEEYVRWYRAMLDREDCKDRLSHYVLETQGKNIESYIHHLTLWHQLQTV